MKLYVIRNVHMSDFATNMQDLQRRPRTPLKQGYQQFFTSQACILLRKQQFVPGHLWKFGFQFQCAILIANPEAFLHQATIEPCCYSKALLCFKNLSTVRFTAKQATKTCKGVLCNTFCPILITKNWLFFIDQKSFYSKTMSNPNTLKKTMSKQPVACPGPGVHKHMYIYIYIILKNTIYIYINKYWKSININIKM